MSIFTPKGQLDSKEIRDQILNHHYDDGYKPSEKLVDEIMDQFWFRDYFNLLISTPYFLDFFKNFLNEGKLTSFNRINFYSYLFKKLFTHKELLILKKASLVFELLQTDKLSRADFKKIINEVDLEKILSIELLIDKKLVIEDVKTNEIKWIHHSITEFLCAEYLLESSHLLENVNRFLILKSNEIKAIKPSWYGVLRFLLEGENHDDLLRWLIDFGNNNSDSIDEFYSDTLSYSVHIERNYSINFELKKQVFLLIYEKYQSSLFWLPIITRNALGKLLDSEFILKLKNDLESKDESGAFVKKGNIVSIIGNALSDNSKVFSQLDCSFWRNKLIELANTDDKNGVLLRLCLHALENFKGDTQLIEAVSKNLNHPDQLVREAFSQLVGEVAPNSSIGIKYIVDAIKKGDDIYARNALYKINTKEGLIFLLQQFVQDKDFLRAFLSRESIFNSGEDNSDTALIRVIKKYKNNQIEDLLKQIALSGFTLEHYRSYESSYFLDSIVLILSNNESFLDEVIDELKKSTEALSSSRLIFNYENLFTLLLTPENVVHFYSRLSSIENGKREAEIAIYGVNRLKGAKAKKILNKAIKEGLIQPLTNTTEEIDYKKQREENIYKEFQHALEPEKNKYLTTVFKIYIQNEIVQKKISKEEKNKLFRLTFELILDHIDPRQFKVTIPDKINSPYHYTITSYASYLGDVIELARLLDPEKVNKYRKKIIDFIPYANSDDQRLISEIIGHIKDEELSWVNQLYMSRTDDRRYLFPNSYLSIISKFLKQGDSLLSPIPVIKSFLADKKISSEDQEYALEVLGEIFLIDKENKEENKLYLEKHFKNKKNGLLLREKINTILVKDFQDLSAINWRVEQIKKRVKPFNRPPYGIVHTVGPLESEMHNMYFASPLTYLTQKEFDYIFDDLLHFSLEILKVPNSEEYTSYTNYIWRIVFSRLDKQLSTKNLDPLIRTSFLMDKYSKEKNSNWLLSGFLDAKRKYIDFVGKPSDISEAFKLATLYGK